MWVPPHPRLRSLETFLNWCARWGLVQHRATLGSHLPLLLSLRLFRRSSAAPAQTLRAHPVVHVVAAVPVVLVMTASAEARSGT